MAQMEWHQTQWRILREFERPEQTLIDRLAQHDSAKIADSMGRHGVMHHEIKPLSPEMRIAGSALTVLTRPGDALFVQKAIDLCRPGDVIVIDAGGYKDVAVIGERLAYYYKRNGAMGIVCDGAVRDSTGILELGLSTFSRGTCIKLFGSDGPGAINVPVQCGGVLVHPGDVIVGDRDGVVVVPREDVARIAELADQHLEEELGRVKRIEQGESMEVVYGVDTKIEQRSGGAAEYI